MDGIDVPTFLDAPKRMLFWTIDQIVPFAIFCVGGMMIGKLFYGMVVGVVMSWAVDRFKNSRSDGLILHFAYFYGLIPMKGRAAINPIVKTVPPA